MEKTYRELLNEIVGKLDAYNSPTMLDGYLNPIAEEYNARLEELGLATIGECNQGTSVDPELDKKEIVSYLVSEGIDEDYASQRVDDIINLGIDIHRIVCYHARYDSEHDCIHVFNPGGHLIQTLHEWTGELNHAVSKTMILLSLIYDSGYTLEELGIR